MTAADFSIGFTFGLVGSLHCVQMCGPIVLSYSLGGGPRLQHLAYNAGRIATYTALGAGAGAMGRAIGALAGFAQAAAIVAGVLMVGAGAAMLGLAPRRGLVQVGAAPLLSRVSARLLRSPGLSARFALGLALGLLPCGLLYAALLKAAGTAEPAGGALTMFAFGLGTAGALAALGAFSSLACAGLRRWSNVLAAAGVLLMGGYLLWRGLLPVAAPACHG